LNFYRLDRSATADDTPAGDSAAQTTVGTSGAVGA